MEFDDMAKILCQKLVSSCERNMKISLAKHVLEDRSYEQDPQRVVNRVLYGTDYDTYDVGFHVYEKVPPINWYNK